MSKEFVFWFAITSLVVVVSLNDASKPKVTANMQAVKILCFKQTMQHETSILHAIKCPEGIN